MNSTDGPLCETCLSIMEPNFRQRVLDGPDTFAHSIRKYIHLLHTMWDSTDSTVWDAASTETESL